MPREIKPLKWLVADLLARHVDELISVCGPSLLHLPPDVRAALLAAARRRGCLDDAALAALMDEGATILDVSHCGAAVTDAGIESLASRGALRRIVAADLTACDAITPRGLRALAAAAPRMHTLRCGGSPSANAAANAAVAPREEVLPGVLPRLRPNPARDHHESWEDLVAEHPHPRRDRDDPDEDVGVGAASLRWLVWPDVDPVRRSRVHLRCPRVRVVAPPPEAYAAAAALADSPSFVAVDGEGWVGYGAAASGTAHVPDAGVPVPTRARTVGRGEDNDGLVVVATGTNASASGGAAAMATSSPWWAPRERAGGAAAAESPPTEADPTVPLDAPFIARLDPRAWGDETGGRGGGGGGRGGGRGGAGGRSGGGGGVGGFSVAEGSSSPRFSGVAGAALRWRLAFAEDDVPVAERFRRACEEVEAARAAKREKNAKKAKNRRASRMGCAERMIHVALDDVSLVRRW